MGLEGVGVVGFWSTGPCPCVLPVTVTPLPSSKAGRPAQASNHIVFPAMELEQWMNCQRNYLLLRTVACFEAYTINRSCQDCKKIQSVDWSRSEGHLTHSCLHSAFEPRVLVLSGDVQKGSPWGPEPSLSLLQVALVHFTSIALEKWWGNECVNKRMCSLVQTSQAY